MTDKQPEAQRLAALLRSRNNNPGGFGLGPICDKAADELLRLNSAHADLERMSMQLAACGVVAMADTPDSAKKARAMHPDYESASCDDVKRRVDECIELRARVAELEDVLTNLPLSSPQRMRARIQRLEEMLAAVGAGGVGPLIPATVQHQRDSSSDNELQRKTGDLITTAAPPQTGGIPPNWQLVPMEATGEMIDAARGLSSFPDGVYRNMLAAAPQPPTTEQSSAVEQPQVEQEPVAEHELKDVRCECCGYMTHHREHMGCIRAAHTKREPLTDEQARRIYNSATYSASLAVFMTRIDAEHPDADDKGVSGWLQEAEDRVKQRAIEAAHNIK